MILLDTSLLHHDPGALQGVLDWVDDRFGPIQKISGIRLVPPEPRWWIYACELARAPAGTWYSPYHFGAAGASIDPHEALQRALGETVERYCGTNATETGEEILLAPIENDIVERLPVCAPDEPCPPSFKGLDLETPIPHVMIRRLVDDQPVPVPSEYVHLNLSRPPSHLTMTLPISTGLAFYADLHSAIWKGLCEVAERDAMMLMWWCRSPVREIACNGHDLPESIVSRLEQLRLVGLTGRLFDMTTDFLVPTVFCVVTGKRFPYFVAGASCHIDPVAACVKALDETVSVRVSLRYHKWSREIPSLDSFDWVRQLEQHMMLYASWGTTPALDFLLHQENPPISFSEFSQQSWWEAPTSMDDLALFAAKLETEGLTVLWTDLTTPDAMEFGRVAKVVVPEMVPLSQDHNIRWLATPRLLRAAGLTKADSSVFNPFPHPFA